MIYPQKINSKKTNLIINLLLIFSIIIGLVLILINKLTTPNIHWAGIANCGVIYMWAVVIYSIKRRNNIAGHVLIQTILASILAIYIDIQLGFRGWSIYLANPIILFVANITMLILTAISYEKYVKYAIYQLATVALSLTPLWLIVRHLLELKMLNRIAIEVSILNLIVSIILCAKDMKDAIIRKLHI
ncbi:MAG: hypothetical protein E7314_02345 [Clostridiales bacterium]|nr:hypothetical protein [Clostridiales bacterium]